MAKKHKTPKTSTKTKAELETLKDSLAGLLDMQGSYITQLFEQFGTLPDQKLFKELQSYAEKVCRQYEIVCRAQAHLKDARRDEDYTPLTEDEIKRWSDYLPQSMRPQAAQDSEH